jgi:hypothetical protein
MVYRLLVCAGLALALVGGSDLSAAPITTPAALASGASTTSVAQVALTGMVTPLLTATCPPSGCTLPPPTGGGSFGQRLSQFLAFILGFFHR